MDNRRSQTIRIVIADDHPIFRDGLRRLLEAEPGLKVIGEACDGNEAVKLARQLKPDIMLLDLAMPRQPGLEALRDLSTGGANGVKRHSADRRSREAPDRRSPATRSARSRSERLCHATPAQEHSHRDGRRILGGPGKRVEPGAVSPDTDAVLARGISQKKFGLTPRELEIVSAVVAGYSNKEIAEYFKISEDTVKHHLSNIFDKLGVSTRLELALFAVNQGLPIKGIP